MRKWSERNTIQAAFWLLCLLPFFLFVMIFRSASALSDSAQDVARTNEVVLKLESLLSEMKDVEVSLREFVLSGDEAYLAPYELRRKRFDEALADLQRLTADTQRKQGVWIVLLQTLIPEKLDAMKQTIAVRREKGLEAASRQVLVQDGSRAMDDIRTVVRNLMNEENALLATRTARQWKSFRATIWLITAILVVNLVFVALLWFMVKREGTARAREADRIQRLNARLEERVRARTKALQQSNDDLQQFAYVASHDLQEPLRAIASYAELLRRRYQGQIDSNADEYINFMVDGVKRMSALIRDLLDYSRAAQPSEETTAFVDTERVLAGVLANLKLTIAEARATISHDPLPPLPIEAARLAQILQNLITNALKYRGEIDPVLHISAEERDGETVVAVRDNGIGIDPRYNDEIFGIFKRLHGKKYEGTGIGLAMCKKIVERQGGRIWVDSAPGKGSTFYFTVPRHLNAMAVTSPI